MAQYTHFLHGKYSTLAELSEIALKSPLNWDLVKWKLNLQKNEKVKALEI
jgi:hypothetical protein